MFVINAFCATQHKIPNEHNAISIIKVKFYGRKTKTKWIFISFAWMARRMHWNIRNSNIEWRSPNTVREMSSFEFDHNNFEMHLTWTKLSICLYGNWIPFYSIKITTFDDYLTPLRQSHFDASPWNRFEYTNFSFWKWQSISLRDRSDNNFDGKQTAIDVILIESQRTTRRITWMFIDDVSASMSTS